MPVSGFYFPGGVVEYAEFAVGVKNATINSIASEYLVSWFASALDETCAAQTDKSSAHRCWDASFLYEHISTPMFVVENRFDQNQINDILLCPTGLNTTGSGGTRAFVADYGHRMDAALASTVRSSPKGDGLFNPSCFKHTGNFCMRGGREFSFLFPHCLCFSHLLSSCSHVATHASPPRFSPCAGTTPA